VHRNGVSIEEKIELGQGPTAALNNAPRVHLQSFQVSYAAGDCDWSWIARPSGDIRRAVHVLLLPLQSSENNEETRTVLYPLAPAPGRD
jgi:hypothetical protein